MPNPLYLLDGQPVEIEAFLQDNAEAFEPEEVEVVRTLQPGEWILFGGGAAAEFEFRRVA